MLKKSNMQWSAKTLFNQVNNGKILFDCAVQRGFVWDIDRKSLLINTMLEDYPIPAFYFARREDGKYDALEGKQRCNAIHSFLSDGFEISENNPAVELESGEELNICGMKFSDLPEWAQDKIKDYSLTIYYFDGITEDEIAELFFRINNGKPLTSTELTRVKAQSLKQFQTIAKHSMIDISVSDKGKIKYNHENIVMQSWALCYSENPDFSTKVFRSIIENANVTDEQIKSMCDSMDYIKAFYDSMDIQDKDQKRVWKKIKTRSHLVSLCYLANKFIQAGKNQNEFSEKAYKFFNSTTTSIDVNYNTSIGSGSARPEKLQMRIEALNKLL